MHLPVEWFPVDEYSDIKTDILVSSLLLAQALFLLLSH